MAELVELLVGEECPVCGAEMDGGSIRYEGHQWAHKNPDAPAQAGHHGIDVLEALDLEVVQEFTPERATVHEDCIYLHGEVAVKASADVE